jgi:hypothetical protein
VFLDASRNTDTHGPGSANSGRRKVRSVIPRRLPRRVAGMPPEWRGGMVPPRDRCAGFAFGGIG